MATVSLKQALDRGIALHKEGKPEEAEKLFRQLISQYPTNPDVLNLLGVVFLRRKRHREAADLFRMAVAVRGDIAEFHGNLSAALLGLRNWIDAEKSARRATEIKPDFARAWSLLGSACSNQRRRDEARDCYRRAIDLDPNDAESHTSLGVYYFDVGQFEQALVEQRAALRLRPDMDIAHLNLALVLLLLGQDEEGWKEYEWRSHCDGLPKHNFRQPLWDGGPLEGKRILLYTEQGLGDAIQFARFAPMVAARGGRVSLICQKELKALLSTIGDSVQVIGRDEKLPEFDIYAPLLSLPRIFKISTANVPADVPYLRADAKLSAEWKSRLADDGASFRVGIAWAGSPSHRRDRERSIHAAMLAPLMGVPNVAFYTLQKGPPAQQLKASPPLAGVIDHTVELRTMADTAALVDNLDLVITVDTSICHVAGALGKAVWVMISKVPHWGWGLESDHTPWYPTMRLFRQEQADAWGPVIARMRDELVNEVSQRS